MHTHTNAKRKQAKTARSGTGKTLINRKPDNFPASAAQTHNPPATLAKP